MTDKLTITEYPAMIREVEYSRQNRAAHSAAMDEHERLIADGWENHGPTVMKKSTWENRYIKQLEPAK